MRRLRVYVDTSVFGGCFDDERLSVMKNKTFDCVQMKHDIQRKIIEEYQGVPDEKRWSLMEQKILADPVLGPFWKNARLTVTPGVEPAPDPAETGEGAQAGGCEVTR